MGISTSMFGNAGNKLRSFANLPIKKSPLAVRVSAFL